MDNQNQNDKKSNFNIMCQVMGLHPIVGIGIFCIDQMLFFAEGVTAGVSYPGTVIVGVILGLASIFIQKGAYNDNWITAIGKGLIVGLLTALPTSIPSFLLLPSAGLGLVKGFLKK